MATVTVIRQGSPALLEWCERNGLDANRVSVENAEVYVLPDGEVWFDFNEATDPLRIVDGDRMATSRRSVRVDSIPPGTLVA